MNRIMLNKLFVFFLLLFAVKIGCAENNELNVNNAHLNYLYEEITVDGKEMAIIHIYSNAPDYKYISDDDEGIACVDDIARAAVYYLYDWQINNNEESFKRNRKLIEFILYMQADNGYFYNFIWDDYSINKDFKTSVAEPNWWSWRALWGLAESYEVYKLSDPVFAERIWNSIEKIINSIKKDIPAETNYANIAGLTIPSWLPYKHASDQASVLLLGLTKYYKQTNDEAIFNYIEKLCDGIVAMQINDHTCEFDGAFLSWENTWHAWGNLQSYSLLKCYEITQNDELLNSALKELNTFYNYLMNNNYLNYFSVERKGVQIVVSEKEKFSQIAYNIRPMVFALLEAYKITGEEKYAQKAGDVALWLTGNNVAGIKMYDEESGRIYDGINSENVVNKNSGAESTIEGLLCLLKIKENELAKKYFLQKRE